MVVGPPFLPGAYVDTVCVFLSVRQPVASPQAGYVTSQAETELPSSLTVYAFCTPAADFQNLMWRGPSPGSALPSEHAVSFPLVASILKMRIRSAPRSGTMMNFPVGSTCTSCGCATSWRELGPFCASVNFCSCRTLLPEKGILNVVMVDGELCLVSGGSSCPGGATYYSAVATKPLPSVPP